MENQLKITKPDGTSHLTPKSNLKNQLRLNALQPDHRKVTIEEVEVNDKGEVVKVIATHTTSTASKQAADTNAVLNAKDQEIEKLKAALAQKESADPNADKGKE